MLQPSRHRNGPPGLAFVRPFGADETPAVYSVVSNFARVAGGTSVTITGERFRSGATVTFGGVPATAVVVVDPYTITCTVPANVVGLVSIVVTNPTGQFATLADSFTYITSTIISVTPNHGPVAGGTTLTILGDNFIAGSAITLDGIAATNVIFLDSRHYLCDSPAHAAGPVDITITEP